MNFKRLKVGWNLKPDDKEAPEKAELNAHLPKGEACSPQKGAGFEGQRTSVEE